MIICGGMTVKRMVMIGVSVEEDENTDCDDGDSNADW